MPARSIQLYHSRSHYPKESVHQENLIEYTRLMAQMQKELKKKTNKLTEHIYTNTQTKKTCSSINVISGYKTKYRTSAIPHPIDKTNTINENRKMQEVLFRSIEAQ